MRKQIKEFINEIGLCEVLNVIAEYCDYMADEYNYYDYNRTADIWRKNAIKIRNLSQELEYPEDKNRKSLK
jgi:hypothetical protein